MAVVHLVALTLIVASGTLSAPRGKRTGDTNEHSLEELKHINIDNHIDLLHSDMLDEVPEEPEVPDEPEEPVYQKERKGSAIHDASNLQSNKFKSWSAVHDHADRDLARNSQLEGEESASHDTKSRSAVHEHSDRDLARNSQLEGEESASHDTKSRSAVHDHADRDLARNSQLEGEESASHDAKSRSAVHEHSDRDLALDNDDHVGV